MGFFKTLFGGKEPTEEERRENKQQYDFEVLTYDGTQALHAGKTDYAIVCLEHALDIREDRETRQRLASAYIQADKLEDAATQYSLLASQYADDPSYPIAQAELLYQLEQYTDMETACNAAIDIDPKLAMPHFLLAKRWAAEQAHETAVAECDKALENKDDYEEARLLRAQENTLLQQYDQAQQDIDRLIADGCDTDEVLMQQAVIHTLQGQFDTAAETYRQVIAQNPFMPEAYIALHALLKKTGHDDEAAQVLEEAKEQLGTDPRQAAAQTKDGFTSVEDYMRNAYNALNPYQLNVNL